MPRRKKSTPLKLNESSYSNLSWSVNDDSEPSFASTSNSINESFSYDKRRIKTDICPEHIVLGQIQLNLPNGEEFIYNEVEPAYLQYVEDGFSSCTICIDKGACNSEDSTSQLKIPIVDREMTKVIPILFSHSYQWILQTHHDNKNILHFYIATFETKMPIHNVANIIEYFYNKDYSDYLEPKLESKINLDAFFKETKTFQNGVLKLDDQNIQTEKLLPQLRSYQVEAVNWMLTREKCKVLDRKNEWCAEVYDSFTSLDNKTIYYNKYADVLLLNPADCTCIPSGGILADEMGLGKTVEVITCILNNPRHIDLEDNENYFTIPVNSSINDNQTSDYKVDNATGEEVACTVKENRKRGRPATDRRSKRRKTVEEQTDIRDTIYAPLPSYKGPGLRTVLNEWYEKILSGYSTVKSAPEPEAPLFEVKCICGEITDISEDWKQEGYAKCSDCETFQHCDCVQYSHRYHYYCPPCWAKQKKIKSHGTLIVTPSAICNQWVEEIEKHVLKNVLKVLVYTGARNSYIQPTELASCDIVITTYNTLRSEINHTSLNDSARKLRKKEKFLKVTSPLTQIEWWRLCLDEAQMVESNISITNQMVNLIHAVHRWSVTGTPIQKTINDLYFLIEFLRVEPFALKVVWRNLIFLPYVHGNKTPLLSLLSDVFWRSSKCDVLDKIMLPEQSFVYHPLKFNAIEKHFYMRLHNEKCEQFMRGVEKSCLSYKQTLDCLNKSCLSQLLGPLLSLRQACSHPQAVRGVFAHKGKMTHEELLDYLVKKTKVESEEAVRRFISALNGLAGIHCIAEDWPKAVECYREVLQFVEEQKSKVDVDTLQRIHTYYNLAEVLEQHPERIPPTLRDSSLRTEGKELENKYLQKITTELNNSRTQLDILSNKVANYNKKIRSVKGWWTRLLHLLSLEGHIDDLLDKINSEISDTSNENKNSSKLFAAKVSSLIGIETTLSNWLDSLEKSKKKVMDHLELLNEVSDEFLVERAVECHLRPATSKKYGKCEICSCEVVLLDYECVLFAVAMKKHSLEYKKVLDGAHTKGSWKPHNAEIALKTILGFAKTKVSESWCLEEGAVHVKMLDALKKEFKQLRVVWRELNHKGQGQDELHMSKLRLRLRLPEEPAPKNKRSAVLKNLSLDGLDSSYNKVETIHILEPHEIRYEFSRLVAEQQRYKSEFKKKHGTLLYLKNLGKAENAKPDPCPICKSALENEWCVLCCGHSFCLECIQVLCKEPLKDKIKCPICRETTYITDICFIDLSETEGNSDVSVIGSHPTKIDSLLRTLIKLKQEDPRVKILVFSTWERVLDELDHALTQNEISFRRMPGYKYQDHLKQFKDPQLNITALLLPITWGSKGLNLIEATHVFLVEPITNPAEELQAIGRVHRIGQTKPTFVHRFFIKGTIEEKIQAAVSSANHIWGENKVTLEDLKNLFVTGETRIQFST